MLEINVQKFKDFPFKRKVNLQTHAVLKKKKKRETIKDDKIKEKQEVLYFTTLWQHITKQKKLFSHLNKNRLSTADITVGCYRVLWVFTGSWRTSGLCAASFQSKANCFHGPSPKEAFQTHRAHSWSICSPLLDASTASFFLQLLEY